MRSKNLPLAALLIIGTCLASGSTAAGITIENSISGSLISRSADQTKIGQTILANEINDIQISESKISDIGIRKTIAKSMGSPKLRNN